MIILHFRHRFDPDRRIQLAVNDVREVDEWGKYYVAKDYIPCDDPLAKYADAERKGKR